MTTKKLGRQTVAFANPPSIAGHANVVGKKEGEGPLSASFDFINQDDTFGEASFEKAESAMQRMALQNALDKAKQSAATLDYIFAGDLLNQCIASSFAVRGQDIPFFGLYGACSTMAESLCVGAMLVDGGHMRNALCAASSHFCTAERQYRFPLEYGSQRTPTAQWTVTGAGAALISAEVNFKPLARCAMVTVGTVTDMGIADANNMGAAMAPAAADTLRRHFADTGRRAEDYDLIITGDLGKVGHDLMLELMQEQGMPLIPSRYMDCGLEVYAPEQEVHAGGSGCGCSAVVLGSLIWKKFQAREVKRVLFMATGALLSTTSSQQGETIPGIAHAIVLEADDLCR